MSADLPALSVCDLNCATSLPGSRLPVGAFTVGAALELKLLEKDG